MRKVISFVWEAFIVLLLVTLLMRHFNVNMPGIQFNWNNQGISLEVKKSQ